MGNVNEERRIVENFQLYSDAKFIQFIEQNIINSPNNNIKMNKKNVQFFI